MERVYQLLDPPLMSLFRVCSDPVTAFFVGTFMLAVVSTIIGRCTLLVAFSINRRYEERLNSDLLRWHDCSLEALKSGEKEAYQGANSRANDAFGKLFFLSSTYSAASLWPAPFMLGWMQRWFGDLLLPLPVTLPLIGSSVHYPFLFILCLIVSSLLFSLTQPYLPLFRRLPPRRDAHGAAPHSVASSSPSHTSLR